MKCKFIFLFSIILYFTDFHAQIAPGNWKEYLPYHRAEKVVIGKNKVYCCTSNSLFYHDIVDGSNYKVSKLQGLSEVEISTIEYAPELDMLIIAYANSNIDVLVDHKISNIPYIKNKITIPDRRINDIMVIGNKAFLSCGFGICLLNLETLQIMDIYYPGNNGSLNRINKTCTDDQLKYIYAATRTGIYKASLDDPFLIDYNRWKLISNSSRECNKIGYFDGKLFALYQSENPETSNDSLIYLSGNSWLRLIVNNDPRIFTINVSKDRLLSITNTGVYSTYSYLNSSCIWWSYYSTFATVDDQSNIWISDRQLTLLVKYASDGSIKNIIPPNSPTYPDNVKIDAGNGTLWSVTGSKLDNGGSLYSHKGAQAYLDNTWHLFNQSTIDNFSSLQDVVNVKINPNDTGIVYMTAWTLGGLIEYNHGKFKMYKAYNTNNCIQPNSVLTKKSSINDINLKSNKAENDTTYSLYGLSFESNGNLWITNSDVKKQLVVHTPASPGFPDGKWKSFSLGPVADKNELVGDVLATSWGDKWIILPTTSALKATIIVFKENSEINNNTIDNDISYSSTTCNLSNIESTILSDKIFCIAEDHKGYIWIGTDAGIVRFVTPQDVFSNIGASGSKILVPIVKGQSEAAYLLETERINTIAIDGADRKWLGTQSSGAYLISEDGINQLEHFTAENSPLFSNTIYDISINQKSGEVFFATDQGIVSFRGYATEGGQDFGKVYVYPNPVRETYKGNIIVTGLIENTIVKITDISGNLVYETKSLGGQAVWDGKNLLGKRANTGVYLVFCSNSDGSKTHVTKLLFIH